MATGMNDDRDTSATPVPSAAGFAAQPKRRLGRLRWWGWTLVGLLVVIVAAGAFFWVEHALVVELGAVSPARDSLLSSNSVRIAFSLPGYEPGRGTPTLTVDKTPVPPSDLLLRSGGVEATLSLADGTHTAVLDYTSANMFSKHLGQTLTFAIDTTAPVITITSPASPENLGQALVRFAAGLSEPATVQLTLDGVPIPLSSGDAPQTEVSTEATVSDGLHEFLLVATDAAGNDSTARLAAWADIQAPVVANDSWPEGEWKETSASVTFTVADNFPDKLAVTATLDGDALALDGSLPPVTGGRAYGISTGELAEGVHELAFLARDEGGHSTTWKRTFLVDSTATFGAREMTLGAIGNDVVELQEALARTDRYAGAATGTYDDATAAAVSAYKAARGLPSDGLVDGATLELLIGSIRIDLSERKLYHYQDGGLVESYSVAVGMPSYPTPTGSFEIISKVRDPSWTPPDSPWARGMEPVPPGPGNPLGTRWMGISSPSVGIHGTYASGSIGTAASHGCIRMYLSEAEELFEAVYLGTPVEIVR